jgi:hypothetical protein
VSDDLLRCDVRSEGFKGSIHLALFGLAAICAAYNAGAAVLLPCARLQRQALLYGCLATWEATQVHRHWGKA